MNDAATSLVEWSTDLTAAREIKGRSLLLYGHDRDGRSGGLYTDVGQYWRGRFELDRCDNYEEAIVFEVVAWAEVPVPSTELLTALQAKAKTNT